jgi:uncharacterized protein (DUF934 family)
MLRLDINRAEDPSRPRSRIESVYEWIAGNDDYQRNDNNLRMIQFCVITVSALGTGFVNAFAHRERLGWTGAALLAALITGFVEKFYFTLRHGLLTIYKSRKQRLAARLCYRVIQATMILNATILCAWVAGIALPEFLQFWNRWSIAVHFGLALIGVSAVRDYDAVAESRIRELKADAAREDIVTIRRAAVGASPFLLLAAKLRGGLDGISLAFKLLRDKPEFSPGDDKPGASGGLFLPSGGVEGDQESEAPVISGKR